MRLAAEANEPARRSASAKAEYPILADLPYEVSHQCMLCFQEVSHADSLTMYPHVESNFNQMLRTPGVSQAESIH